MPHLAFQPADRRHGSTARAAHGQVVTSFYLRLRVADQAGVLAKVTGILADAGISIDAVLQREADEWAARVDQTDLIILTHDARRGAMNGAMAQMQALPTVLAPSAHPQGRAELPQTPLTGFWTSRHAVPLAPAAHPDRKHFYDDPCSRAWRPTAGCTCRGTTRMIDDATLAQLARCTTAGLRRAGVQILSLYIDDIPAADLHALCQTYTAEGVRHRRDRAAAELEDGLSSKPCPTAPRWPSRTWPCGCSCWATCSNTNWGAGASKLNILGATSGDTGSAAEYAMRGKAGRARLHDSARTAA